MQELASTAAGSDCFSTQARGRRAAAGLGVGEASGPFERDEGGAGGHTGSGRAGGYQHITKAP